MPEPHRRRRLPVEQAYPRVARWVQGYGWIELGHDDMGRSFVRALDDGGLVWEGPRRTPASTTPCRPWMPPSPPGCADSSARNVPGRRGQPPGTACAHVATGQAATLTDELGRSSGQRRRCLVQLSPKILQAPLLGGPRSAVPGSATLKLGPRVLAAGDQGPEPSQDAPRRSRFAVGSRHRHARSRGSRLTAGVRLGIGPPGCLARAPLSRGRHDLAGPSGRTTCGRSAGRGHRRQPPRARHAAPGRPNRAVSAASRPSAAF